MNFKLLKFRFLTIVFAPFQLLYSQQKLSSIADKQSLLTNVQWESLFPNRAGLASGHPQGYSTDFFSYNNFIQARNEMADYWVKIRKKQGVYGELITITKKSSQVVYNYSQVDPSWYANTTAETVINVDFADFVNTSNTLNNTRELGAFLANISKETTGGWQTPVGGGSLGDYAKWGLYFVHELGYNTTNSAGAYSQASTEYPANPTKGYYGRGPIQLSWNYNYGQFSKFLYNDKNVLLDNPDLVQQDGVLAFKSAIWFWMMPQWPKPSCHQVMHDLWVPSIGEYAMNKMYLKGFAHTNNIINGGLECRGSSSAAFTVKVVLRSDLYKYYLGILGLNPNQIAAEDSGQYTTTCFQDASNAMQDYQSANVLATKRFDLESFSYGPNPVQENLKIKYKKTIDQINVYGLDGKEIQKLRVQKANFELDCSKFEKGVYLLQVISEGESAIFRIIKN
ncbi:glycoside hydrolase family 19 protein [Flavobacterium columnare]|uniref:glycoside hydrolase family 19 protein n=1 Tax=Flavobacterium columnare TaxID=996 RepID=UPI000981984D|nr:glycoside hydrolase family 19 protein [Flavobacterium columnare]OOB82036.1 hypothetical protein BZL53_11715 [Flavobacterium columnare]